MVDPPDAPVPLEDYQLIEARGRFALAGERRLMLEHGIDLIVSEEQRRRCDLCQDPGGARTVDPGGDDRPVGDRPAHRQPYRPYDLMRHWIGFKGLARSI